MSTHTQFVNVLQNKKQSVFAAKANVLNRVTAAKQRILSPVTIIPTYDDVQAVSYDDALTSPEMYDNVYIEGTQPYQQPPVEVEEGNVRKHTDGTFSVIEDDGYVHNFGSNEQEARSYGAYSTAQAKAREEDAPDTRSSMDVVNRLGQGLTGIFGSGYKGVVGIGATLRNQIEDYNSRGPWKTPVVQLGREDQGTKWYKITEEDESRFNNIEQLPSEIQQLYRKSLKFKILTELKNRAEIAKEKLVVAEKDIADINKIIPVNRAVELARSTEFKYVAETDGLWEATKHTLGSEWDSYLYGGIDAIPYMVILATGNAPVVTSLVASMAMGNNVDNTQEFIKLNNGKEPTKDEAARILAFSTAQAAVDAIGDRLAVAGLPKGVVAALSTQLTSAKKVLSSTVRSVPRVLDNFVARTAIKVATLPIKTGFTEGTAGAAEAASKQIAVSGKITDTADIVESAIEEAFAAPVGAVGAKTAVATGKFALGIGKRIVGKGNKDAERKERPTGTTGTPEIIEPPLPIDKAEFDTLIGSVVYAEGEDQTKNIKTLYELGKRELTSTQEEIHAKKVTELKNKINNKTANTNPVDDEGKASLENVVNLTEEEFKKVEEELTGSKESKEEDKVYLESISKLITAKKRAEASISTVSEDIRDGVEERHKGASTLFSEIKTLVNSLVAPNANPDQINREILTKINELQTHSGNLEKKEEAFRKAENYVVDESKEIPESAELDTNEAIVDENGVKPRVGTGNIGSAIVIGTTKNRSTTYTVYYNQSRTEIDAANKEHEGYVTEITRLEAGGSSISNLINAVAADNKYVDAVATTATAYLKSTIHADTKNRVVALKSQQATIAALAEQEYIRSEIEATGPEIDALDAEPTRTGTINVFWGKPESNESTKILSNLAPRTFTYEGREYGSVEHAYQSNKSGTFDQDTYTEYVKIKGFGRKIQGKASTDQLKKADSLGLMKKLVVESFIQNPDSDAAVKLMQYAEFTHDNDGLIDQAFLDGLYLAQESLDKSAQDAADTNVTDTDSQTTLTEETSPEGTPVTPQEETTEVPTEGSSAEIQAQIDALVIKKEKAKVREKAEAAEQKTAPVDTATEETTPTVTTETIHGVSVTYTEVDDNAISSLAANSNEQGIKIRKNITVDSVINYMLGNHVQGDKGKQAKIDVKNEVTTKINEEYGVNFLEILKGLSDTEIRNFILLHEYRHTQQRDKRDTTEEFIADYNANKVTFEKDANVYALKRMQLLPGKLTAQESIQESSEAGVPKKGDVVTLEFYFEKEDKLVPVKVTIENIKEIEQGRTVIKDNKGNIIEEIPGLTEYELDLRSNKGKTYSVIVGTDGNITQFLGDKGGLKVGTDNYILEFNLESLPTQQTSEVSYKVDNNLSLQESELDVHTLSVLFPAAINADGTLKTGNTADAAVNKLGKFLKVCE